MSLLLARYQIIFTPSKHPPILADLNYAPMGRNPKTNKCSAWTLNVAVSARSSDITCNRLPHMQRRVVRNVSTASGTVCSSTLSCLKTLPQTASVCTVYLPVCPVCSNLGQLNFVWNWLSTKLSFNGIVIVFVRFRARSEQTLPRYVSHACV